jgi:hypothetical protein
MYRIPRFYRGIFFSDSKKISYRAQLLLLNISCEVQPARSEAKCSSSRNQIAIGSIQLYASGYVVKEASGNVCGDREFRMHQIHSFISYKKYSP